MNAQNTYPNRLFLIIVLFFAATGIGINLYATVWGAALSDDSFSYIKPARDIISGLPYQFNAHYPPGLPLILAAIGKLTSLDPIDGIRYINALCFGLNIFLSGLLVKNASKSPFFGVASASLVLLAQPMIEVHAWAMSEALFISLVLSCLTCLGQYLETRQISWLIPSIILAGFASLTRYAGTALIAAGGLTLLLYQGRRWTRRWFDFFLFAGIAGGLFLIYPLSMSSVSREFQSVSGFRFGSIGLEDWNELIYTSLLWLMPGRLARGREFLIAGTITVLLISFPVTLAILKHTQRSFFSWLRQIITSPHLFLLAFFAAASGYILYQASQADRYRSPYDFRLMAPIHLAILLLSFILLGFAWPRLTRFFKVSFLILFTFVFGLYFQRAIDTTTLYHQDGMGFASRYWHDSDLLDFIGATEPDTFLVTTAPYGVYFATNRQTELFSNYTPEQLADRLKESHGYFIMIESMPIELYGINSQDYLSRLREVLELNNAIVFQAP